MFKIQQTPPTTNITMDLGFTKINGQSNTLGHAVASLSEELWHTAWCGQSVPDFLEKWDNLDSWLRAVRGAIREYGAAVLKDNGSLEFAFWNQKGWTRISYSVDNLNNIMQELETRGYACYHAEVTKACEGGLKLITRYIPDDGVFEGSNLRIDIYNGSEEPVLSAYGKDATELRDSLDYMLCIRVLDEIGKTVDFAQTNQGRPASAERA